MKRKRIKILKQIKPYIAQCKMEIIIMLVASALIIPLTLINPKLFQVLVDEVMGTRNKSNFLFVAVGLLTVFLIKSICEWLNLTLGNKIKKKFKMSIRKDVFEIIIGLPYAKFLNKETGDWKMRMTEDIDSLGDFIKSQVMEYLFSMLTVAVIFILTLCMQPLMTLCCLSIYPIVFVINYILGKKSQHINENIRTATESYYTDTYHTLQHLKDIKLSNNEEVFIRKFHKHRNILAKLGLKNMQYWSYWEVFNDFKANYLTKVFVYIVGAFFVINGNLSVGTLIMFAEYFSILFTSLDTLVYKQAELNMTTPCYKRVFEMLQSKKAKSNKNQVKFIRNLELDNITFAYPETNQKVLKDIRLKVNWGDWLIITGESGCGKSTLIKLILGLYAPDKGDIQINGISITDVCMNCVGVMQDSYFFNISIKENLLFAKPNASNDELDIVCKAANIYEFIQESSSGINTVIGEKGVKLSGGQRQRLAIARALLKKPEVLILDESTSALDKENEEQIIHNIRELLPSSIVIEITHRLNRIQSAQQVVVMENGRIVKTEINEYHPITNMS